MLFGKLLKGSKSGSAEKSSEQDPQSSNPLTVGTKEGLTCVSVIFKSYYDGDKSSYPKL